jgi:uncharacterized membrane protein YgcG
VQFACTQVLPPGSGLTVSVLWRRGLAAQPSAGRVLFANKDILLLWAGLALVVVYYMVCWALVGRDPQPGPLMPVSEPPEGLGPAALRYVRNMGYDRESFACALVSMAIKRYVTIDESAEACTVRRVPGATAAVLAPEERVLAESLLGSREELTLSAAHGRRIARAVEKFKRALSRENEKKYFLRNKWYWTGGVGLSAAVALGALAGSGAPELLFMAAWLTGWSVGVALLLSHVCAAWRGVVRSEGLQRAAGVVPALVLTAFAAPFVAAELFVATMVYLLAGGAVATGLVGLGAVNAVFYDWMKAPTLAGRELLDKAAGFEEFLRRQAEQAPYGAEAAAMFERHLAYAMALGGAEQWASRFADKLPSGPDAAPPGWYAGPHWVPDRPAELTYTISASIGTALARATVGSAGSGGSGGSSGGGGGGGGGGGW